MTAMPHHKTVAFNPVSSGAACTMQQATHNPVCLSFKFLSSIVCIVISFASSKNGESDR